MITKADTLTHFLLSINDGAWSWCILRRRKPPRWWWWRTRRRTWGRPPRQGTCPGMRGTRSRTCQTLLSCLSVSWKMKWLIDRIDVCLRIYIIHLGGSWEFLLLTLSSDTVLQTYPRRCMGVCWSFWQVLFLQRHGLFSEYSKDRSKWGLLTQCSAAVFCLLVVVQ